MHPYHHHHEDKVAKRRVHHIMKHANPSARAQGGAVHGDEAEDRRLVKSMLKQHDEHIHGKKGRGRLDKFARGGRTKGGSHTTVNVVVPPHRPQPPPLGALGAAGPAPPPPPMGPAAPPMGGPSGMLPGGGMPPPGGMPMRARGGKVDGKGDFLPGESSPENLRNWAAYASRNSYASGGATHEYPKYKFGSQTGMGRKEETHEQKRRRGK